MYNLANALMHALESFFNDVPLEYPSAIEIRKEICKQHACFDTPDFHEIITIRLRSLVDYKILHFYKNTSRYGPGNRWKEVPTDQLEE